MEKVDIKTLNGHLFTCNDCNKIHFEFNQMGIDFSSISTLSDFFNYLTNLDGQEFELLNKDTMYQRKIQIPFPNTAIKLLLSLKDLQELKILLSTFIDDYTTLEKEKSFMRELSKVSIKQLN